jgi:hypothetical protein
MVTSRHNAGMTDAAFCGADEVCRLQILDRATSLTDLAALPSHRLEALCGDRVKGGAATERSKACPGWINALCILFYDAGG